MEAAIFILYLFLFGFAVATLPFFKKSGIGAVNLISLFIIKICAGIAYGRFYLLPKYYTGSDTWRFYRLSLEEKQWLLKNPVGFIQDLFVHGYSRTGSLFAGKDSYWNDLKSNIPIKLMACMNVITFDSYYTNIILFNFLFLFGFVGLFIVFNSLFPGKKWFSIMGIFLLPSVLFWCSGIHKDGLILSALGMIVYHSYKFLDNHSKSIYRCTSILVYLLLIFALRNYVALALLPLLFCWYISSRLLNKTSFIFFGVYLSGIVLFFTVQYLIPSINPMQQVVEKQSEFLELGGGSVVHSIPLTASLKSFIQYFPLALDMALFRPHISEIKSLSYIPAALEIVLFILMVILYVLFHKQAKLSPFVWFCFFFSLSILIIAGYTITLSGAIIRYRSLVLPFLFTPILCTIDVEKLKFIFFKKNRTDK